MKKERNSELKVVMFSMALNLGAIILGALLRKHGFDVPNDVLLSAVACNGITAGIYAHGRAKKKAREAAVKGSSDGQ